MAAFEAEAEAICKLLRLDVTFLVSSDYVAAMHLRPIILTKTVKWYVRLLTAAKHIVYASLVAIHFLEIERCELADLYQDT